MPGQFYSDKLYPFMDRVMLLLGQTDTEFYLTGGTALGRHYLDHRYSDDLDFFVNQAADFRDQVKKTLDALRSGGIAFETGITAVDFVRIIAGGEDVSLKIDFINDVAFHYGDLQAAAFFPRVDHWRNILSNKLCALSRREPKDVADILFLAGRYMFSWPDVLGEARQKDLWVEPLEVSRILNEFPADLFAVVKWTKPIDEKLLESSLHRLALAVVRGGINEPISSSFWYER